MEEAVKKPRRIFTPQQNLSRLSNRLATRMVELPEFDAVFRAVKRAFRQAGLG